MLRDEIHKKLVEAMKAQEKLKLEALRYLWSLIKNAEIDEKKELTDEQVIKIIGGEVKKRKEAIEPFDSSSTSLTASAQGKQTEKMAVWVKDEKAKVKVLQEFLPEQMGEGEVSELVNQVISELSTKDFGRIMGEVMKRVQGKADGKVVSEIVKRKIDGSQ